MVIETLLGLVIFAAAISPGYVFTRVAERRGVRPARSPLLEAAELVFAGMVTTGLSTMAVLLFGYKWSEAFIHLGEWAAIGSAYLAEHPFDALRSLFAVFAFSLALAAAAALGGNRHRPSSFFPEGTVWGDVFNRAAKNRHVFVSVLLTSGEVVEGYRLSSGNTIDEQREIAVAKPIYFTPSGGLRTRLELVDAAIIPAVEVKRIGVRYDELQVRTPRARGLRARLGLGGSA